MGKTDQEEAGAALNFSHFLTEHVEIAVFSFIL